MSSTSELEGEIKRLQGELKVARELQCLEGRDHGELYVAIEEGLGNLSSAEALFPPAVKLCCPRCQTQVRYVKEPNRD